MRLVVSGKCTTGDRAENIRIAHDALIELMRKGHEVFCPHTMFSLVTIGEVDEEAVMATCLSVVQRWAQGIVMLPGWEDSPGARREYTEARTLGLALYMGADSVPNCNKTQ